MRSIKISGYRTGIKFDKGLLAVEQNNCTTKTVNAFIIFDLVGWPKNPTNNFKLKYCLLGVTTIVKSSEKERCIIVMTDLLMKQADGVLVMNLLEIL